MAATERTRRATAGKRMTFLTGQALEDDEAFWGHDTWESDNESFRSADQDDGPDVFDSDFDETEESSDEDEAAVEAEKELAAEERMNDKKRKAATGYSERQGGGGYGAGAKPPGRFGMPVSSSFGGGNKKSKGSGKRIVGDGHNAGIVLNLPQLHTGVGEGTNGGATAAAASMGTMKIGRPRKAPVVAASWSSSAHMMAPIPALAARRERRSAREASGYSNESREIAAAAAAKAAKEAQQHRKQSSPAKSTTSTKTKGQVIFQQSDLLLEAVNDTEPNNERWLLGRKRIQAERELTNADKSNSSSATYSEKFVSRRGYLNTINFADMDRIPQILLQKKRPSAGVPPKVPLCAITGKPARYRDPKSGHGYYDLEAFRALRTKWEAEQQQLQQDQQQVEVEIVATERISAEKAKKKRPRKTNGKKSDVPTTTETTGSLSAVADGAATAAANLESSVLSTTIVPADGASPPLPLLPLEGPISVAAINSCAAPAAAIAAKRKRAGRPKAAAKHPTGPTASVDNEAPSRVEVPVVQSVTAAISGSALAEPVPKRRPGRPKGTYKNKAAASRITSAAVADNSSTTGSNDLAMAVTAASLSSAATAVAVSTIFSPPPTVAAQAPPQLSPSQKLSPSSSLVLSTIPSPTTTATQSPAAVAAAAAVGDGSSRRSPRRHKPSARMLESIEEGLFPTLPESSMAPSPPLNKSDKKNAKASLSRHGNDG